MKVFILFGQRKESYTGEYAPEVFDVIDEYSDYENKEYREVKRDEILGMEDIISCEWFEVELGESAKYIRDILYKRFRVIEGKVTQPNTEETRPSPVTVTPGTGRKIDLTPDF